MLDHVWKGDQDQGLKPLFKLRATINFNPMKLNELPAHCMLGDSNFDFRYVSLGDLDIPREKSLNYLQTVKPLIRRRVLRRLIWVCTICQITL